MELSAGRENGLLQSLFIYHLRYHAHLFPPKRERPAQHQGHAGHIEIGEIKAKSWSQGGISLLFPDTGDGKIENLTVQVIHSVQHRIAPGIKMLLFHAENLHGSVAAQLHGQRIIL